jgi:hypothetical protein
MSFFLTTQQFIDGTKDVTRRLGWANLKPGDHFMAVEKAQGLKPGEKIRKLGECVCKDNSPEPLHYIKWFPYRPNGARFNYFWPEVQREGFPDLTPEQFVEMFCREMSTKKRPVTPETIVNRIEFARVRS